MDRTSTVVLATSCVADDVLTYALVVLGVTGRDPGETQTPIET